MRLYRGRDWLYQKYITEKLSINTIARILNVHPTQIWYWLKKHQIKRRTLAEAAYVPHKGKKLSEKIKRNMSIAQKLRYLNDRSASWAGGRIRKNGYVYIWNPTHPNADRGYVAEHRLVAEKVLGRHLKSHEIPHHINFNRADNRNSNLLICTTGYNFWLHAKIRRLGLEDYFKNLRQIAVELDEILKNEVRG